MKKRTNYTYIVSGPNGRSEGPFDLRQMEQKVAAGQVTGSTVVQRSDSADWSTAAGFPELEAKDVVVSPYDQEADALTLEIEQSRFRSSVRKGAVWFFWIGALSFPNALFAFLGKSAGFALGLSVVYPIGEAGPTLGTFGIHTALVINIALCLAFLYFGVAGWTTRFIPYMLGFALYAGDTALAVASQDWISTAIHCVGLFALFSGAGAHLDRRELSWTCSPVIPYLVCAMIFAGSALGVRASLLPAKDNLKAEPWRTLPPREWPTLVLTHQAHFQNRSSLEGASAFLMELRNGSIVAVTANHLLGSAGGVEPRLPVTEVDRSLIEWKLFPRAHPNDSIIVKGVYGPAEAYSGDSLLLRVVTNNIASVAKPLKLRLSPVTEGEAIFIAGVRYADPAQRQEVYKGTVSSADDELITVDLKAPVDMSGFSGAPLLDSAGHVIGVVTGSWGLTDDKNRSHGVMAHSMRELARVLRTTKAWN
jgi:S1-C subfamily serine protease